MNKLETLGVVRHMSLPHDTTSTDIHLAEAQAVLAALEQWADIIPTGSSVLVLSDNMIVVQVLTDWRGSGSPQMQSKALQIYQAVLKMQLFSLEVAYICTTDNLVADSLSRIRPEDEVGLTDFDIQRVETAASALLQRQVKLSESLDAFASRLLHVSTSYRLPENNWLSIPFSSVEETVIFCFPPTRLLPALARKIRREHDQTHKDVLVLSPIPFKDWRYPLQGIPLESCTLDRLRFKTPSFSSPEAIRSSMASLAFYKRQNWRLTWIRCRQLTTRGSQLPKSPTGEPTDSPSPPVEDALEL